MKDKLQIGDFRKKLAFRIDKGVSIAVYLFHFLERYKIDWDVYLPSIGKNLQRPFVWTLKQKQELIISVLKGIKIPSISVILHDNIDSSKNVYKIIDGKQRLSSLIGFLKGEFPIEWEGKEYYYNDLGESAQGEIRFYGVIGDLAYEDDSFPISDEQKIAWFEMINFAGTPQDEEHLKALKTK